MKKKWINFLGCILFAFSAAAQTTGYKYYTSIENVPENGFYNITLAPYIDVHLKTDYSDVRIVGKGTKWIPHVLNEEKNVLREAILRKLKYTVVENTPQQTVLLVEADKFADNRNVIISTSNIIAERYATLSGSDDQKNWSVMRDSVLLNPYPAPEKSNSEMRIAFPLTLYEYFRLTIYNNNEKLNILKANTGIPEGGFYLEYFPVSNVIQNPAVMMTQKDSGKISYIKVMQPGNFHFDRISYDVTGAKFFNRKAELYVPDSGEPSPSRPGKLYNTFTIADNESYNVKLPVNNTIVFYILVYNENEPPLTFTKLSTSLNQRYLTAYLEKGQHYSLIFDNAAATPPSYDLKLSDTLITQKLPFLKTDKITLLKHSGARVQPTVNYKWVMWAVMGAIIIALALFSFRMRKETNKKQTHVHI